MLRQTTVAPFTAIGSAARPLGAKSGVRVGTPNVVSVTSTTWTVQPFVGIIDGEAAAVAGPYGYAFDTAQTGTVTAAEGSVRKDTLAVQVSDPAEGDATSAPSIKIVYTKGTAGSSLLPALPARSHLLCVINVPATGGGSPTVSWVPEWCGDPGEWTFNTVAERDAYVAATGSSVPVNQRATVIEDSTATNNGDYAWSGTLWLPVSGRCVPHARWFKTTAFIWGSTPAVHTWDASPVEGVVSGFTTSGGTQRFTITTPGLWRFSGAVGLGSGSFGNLQIKVNGTVVQQFNNPSTSNTTSGRFDWEQQLAVGDYVEIWLTGGNTSGATSDSGNQITFLNVDYLHA
jgi:hypothetical protein